MRRLQGFLAVMNGDLASFAGSPYTQLWIRVTRPLGSKPRLAYRSRSRRDRLRSIRPNLFLALGGGWDTQTQVPANAEKYWSRWVCNNEVGWMR